MTLERRLRARLDALREQHALRSLPAVSHRQGVRYHLDGRPVVGFCSNDYLGLASAVAGGLHAPSGAGASRLICGDLPEHRDTERRLASLVGQPDAVVFPSGFQLNVGVVPALLTSDDIAYSDRLNHASIIDGLRLASASVEILPHGSPPPLCGPGRWWITESIFSMDGDTVDVAALRNHAAGGGHLYVDEAHALGLFAGGTGWLGAHACKPDVHVGTLSKAFGCAGAFVAGSVALCDLVRNHARSFVYSTATSPLVLAAITRSLDLICGPEGDRRRARLWDNVARLGEALQHPSPLSSPIMPLLVGHNDAAVRIASALLDRGWHVQPIRPPTVPPGTARLRLTVTADHQPGDIEGLAADILDVFARADLPVLLGHDTSRVASAS